MTSSTAPWRHSLLSVLLVLLGGCAVGGGGGADGASRSPTAIPTSAPVPAISPSSAGTSALALDDRFDGARLDPDLWSTGHWWGPEGCTISSNEELEWYTADQVAVSDGHLALTADAAEAPQGPDSLPYVSGMVTTGPQEEGGEPKFAFTYGRVEVRFESPSGRGLWPAIWMLPASTRSRPEIDLYEARAQHPETWFLHMHPKDRNRESASMVLTDERLGAGAHVIALEWQPGRLTWSVDGRQAWTVTGEDVPDEPMYLVMNLAVGGNMPGPPDATTPFPAIFRIDRVRIWQSEQGS